MVFKSTFSLTASAKEDSAKTTTACNRAHINVQISVHFTRRDYPKSPGTRPGQLRLTKNFPRVISKVLSLHAIVAGDPLSCENITNIQSYSK